MIKLPEDFKVSLRNIVVGLSKTYRWGTKFKYSRISVLAHSNHVSHLVPESLKIYGLLHDAAEAYIQDIPSPYKKYLKDYKKLEKEIMTRIAKKYKLDIRIFSDVRIKAADVYAANIEKRMSYYYEKSKTYRENPVEGEIREFTSRFRRGIRCWRKISSRERKKLLGGAKKPTLEAKETSL